MANTETEKILSEAAQTENVRDAKGRWLKKAKRFFTFHEKQDREDQLNRMKRQLNQPQWVNNALSSDTAPQLARGIRTLQDDLEENAPPTDLKGETRDALARRHKELRAQIREGMLTHEEMRRNPPGAVDRHRRWEKANKNRILEYKNISRLLEPESDSKDLASIEIFRPHGRQGQYNPNAQITGHFTNHQVPDENWERTFGEPKVQTPLKSAEQREKMEARLAKARAAKDAKFAALRAARAAAAETAQTTPEVAQTQPEVADTNEPEPT